MANHLAIHVVGAGGIGCALGYALRSAGADVVFVERNPNKVEYGRQQGFAVSGRPRLAARFVAFSEWSPANDAIILLCTKCYDNAEVLARLPKAAQVMPVQNGIDPQLDARGHAAEGISSFVSECDPDKPVTRITRAGALHLGGRGNGMPDWLPRLAGVLRTGNLISVVEVPDVRPFKHAKLMYNAAISPLAAAAGMDNGKLLSDGRARRLFFALLRENYSILNGAGLPLDRVGPFHPRTVNRILKSPWLAGLLARAFEPGLRGTYCSMAGDIEKGQTEIDSYNGQLIALAGNRPCPLNRRVMEVVQRMTREGIAPHMGALDWFSREPGAHAR